MANKEFDLKCDGELANILKKHIEAELKQTIDIQALTFATRIQRLTAHYKVKNEVQNAQP